MTRVAIDKIPILLFLKISLNKSLHETAKFIESVGVKSMYITENDKVAIRKVIEKQISAFQRDDAIEAFAIASEAIQKQFETPDKFIKMVKESYRAVYRPRSVMFRGFTTVDYYPAQIVILMDEKGELIQAIYIMKQQQDLSWRIHGCFLVSIDEKIV